jgi:hypothetical protein
MLYLLEFGQKAKSHNPPDASSIEHDMSIYRLMRDAAEQEPAPPRRVAAPQWDAPLKSSAGVSKSATASESKSVAEIAGVLSKYLPSEVVALYVAILPFLVPKDTPLTHQDYTGRWAVAGIIGVIAVIYAVGFYRRERHAQNARFVWHVAIGKALIVLIAFAAWVCLVPGSPFNSISWYTPSTGAIIGLLVAGALGALAVLFEI